MHRFGFKDNQIAETVGITVGNLRVIRYRACRRLRKDLGMIIRKKRWTMRLDLGPKTK